MVAELVSGLVLKRADGKASKTVERMAKIRACEVVATMDVLMALLLETRRVDERDERLVAREVVMKGSKKVAVMASLKAERKESSLVV